MATDQGNTLFDGYIELKGVDGSKRPSQIPRSKVHRAINAQFRNDEAKPRPGWIFQSLTYESEIVARDINQGRFQGAAVYDPDSGDSFLLVMAGGRLFKIDILNQGAVTDVSIRAKNTLLDDFAAPAISASVSIDVDRVSNIAVGTIVRVGGSPYYVLAIDADVIATLSAPFVAPAVNATATAAVVSSAGFIAGRVVLFSGKRYRVSLVGGPASIDLTNLDDTPGTNYAAGAVFSFSALLLRNESDPVLTAHSEGEAVEYYDVNSSQSWRAWNAQAQKWSIWQDGSSRALIFDGATSRRAASDEVPIGKSMAEGFGRLWVALPDDRRFVAGDLIYGPSGTAAEQYRDAILKFTENTYIAEGGAFGVPAGSGRITGIATLAQLDTSLGQGSLQVFTDRGGFTVNAQIPRSEWINYNANKTPVQTVSLKNNGCASDRTIVDVNSDLFFRSSDGIRSYQLARREFGRWWNTPMSKEVDWVLTTDPQALLFAGSAVLADKRFVCTCGPQITERGIIHKGVVAMDIEQITWTDEELPFWDGLWTAAYVYQLVSGKFRGVDRTFAICQNGDGNLEIYEVSKEEHEDRADATQGTKIRWAIEFASISFPTSETIEGKFDLKQLFGGEVMAADVEDEVTFKARFRPDGYSCWVVWHWWKVCATLGACEPNTQVCPDWDMGKPQMIGPMGLPQPPGDICDSSGRPLRNFYLVQPRLDVRGYCVLKSFRLAAKPVSQPVTARPLTRIGNE